MNIRSFHSKDKPVESVKIFDAEAQLVQSIQILAGQVLKEQFTPVPAFLICISGKVQYHDNNEITEELGQGDFVQIEQLSQFRLLGKEDSNLLLIK